VLADKVGIAAGTIYRYFDNKEALLVELHRHICTEISQSLFCGWALQQTTEKRYACLWRNAFNTVLQNPQRLAVMEMLCSMPNLNRSNAKKFEDSAFFPLVDFYQQGIDEKRFHDWPIPALIALSFDSAGNLAKKVLRERLEVDEQLLMQVRDASWKVIQTTS